MPHLKGHTGIKWNFEIDGEGDELMFIHGWGVDKRIWRQQTKYFSQYYRVLAIDLPGHGKSSYIKVAFEDMAEDVGKILKHIVKDKITIVGSSLGGLLGLQVYDKFSDMINRLVFVGSMPKFAMSEDYPYGIDIERMKTLGGQLNSAYPSIVDIFFRSLFTKEERQSRRYKWLQKFRQFDEKPMKQALADYLEILKDVDLRDALQRVDVPMHFMNGYGDEICTNKTVDYIRTLVPKATFVDFEQCGHFPFLSKPHEFNQVLNEFLYETK